MSTVVYKTGVCFASVCTDDDDGVMLATVNATHPSGTAGGWKLTDEVFADGTPNPAPCNIDPARRHVLVAA